MKTTRRFQKTCALFLTLVLVFTMVCGNTSYAAASGSKKVTKLTVKTTGTMLNEGQVLTKTTLKKSLKVTAKLKNGKTKKKYASYSCKQIGKTIKPDSKGKYKVTLKAGAVKKTVSIKVNRIQKIYVKKCSLKFTEGAKFDVKAFKKAVTVYADYKKGADKKLTTYTITAPKVVTADSKGKFVVTLKYGSKKTTVAVPVEKKPTTEEPSTEKPTPGGTTPTRPAEPMKVYFYGDKYKLSPEDSAVFIYISLDSPEDCLVASPKYYTNVELGYLYTTEDLDETTMILGSSANKDSYGNINIRNTHWQDIFDIPDDLWNSSTTVKVRIYAVITTVENTTETIYSDILSFKLE